MKTPSTKTALALAIALACTAVSSTAFAKVHTRKTHAYAEPDVLVNRPVGSNLSDPNCTFALDWHCPSPN